MVVEDEPAIQELIACNLELGGTPAFARRDASSAGPWCALRCRSRVVDWMLPGMSGIESRARLRADKRTQEVPVIMLTARADEA